MQFLISAEWVIGEAQRQGIHVSDQQVATQFATIKKQQFPTAAAYNAFLASSGETLADLLLRVKLELLSTQLRNKATKGSSTVTSAQIANYYNAHKSTYGTPESRNVSIILVKTLPQAQCRARADQRRHAVRRRGQEVVDRRRHEEDRAARSPTSSAGRRSRRSTRRSSRPRSNKLLGPVKTPFGYYVFKVTKVTPAVQQPLSSVSATIKQQLLAQGQQTALTKFVTGFTKRWTALTVCRSTFVVMDCKNYVAPKASPAGSHRRDRRRRRLAPPRVGRACRPRSSSRPSLDWTRSRAGCAANALGIASRTSARSCRTRSRRPTSSPTPRTPATTPRWSTSSAMCSSRCTSLPCCSRSAAPAIWPRSPITAPRS